MKTVNIEIPSEVGNMLDRLHYEVEARKQVIGFCASNNTQKVNDDFMREYVSLFMELDQAKAKFEQDWLSDYPNRMRWTILGGTTVVLEMNADEA